MVKRKEINQSAGFTLFEVMIAIAIFAVFATVFVTGQGFNVLDSSKLKNEMILKDLCQNKINEIISNPPELKDSLTLTKDTKSFENFPDYQYSTQYQKIFIPDMSKLKNSADEDDSEKKQSDMEKRIYNVFKENMEKMIWQVEVEVKDKLTGDTFRLTTWLYNQNAEIDVKNF
jgi:prepilin-type N-terminal cleavage/methylation domain-containing protein